MNDVRKYIYGTLLIFVFGVLIWVGFVFVNACGFTTQCVSGQPVERTSIPTLIPATLPAADRFINAPAESTPSAGENCASIQPGRAGNRLLT